MIDKRMSYEEYLSERQIVSLLFQSFQLRFFFHRVHPCVIDSEYPDFVVGYQEYRCVVLSDKCFAKIPGA